MSHTVSFYCFPSMLLSLLYCTLVSPDMHDICPLSSVITHLSSVSPSKPYQTCHRDFPLSYYSQLLLYFHMSSTLVTRSRPLFSRKLLFQQIVLFLCHLSNLTGASSHPLSWVGCFLYLLSHNDSLCFFFFLYVIQYLYCYVIPIRPSRFSILPKSRQNRYSW